MTRSRAVLACALAVLALATGCSGPAGSREQPVLTVLAASSLTGSFQQIRDRFVERHPGVRVRFDFQGSSLLAEQIRQGRSAGVYASADTRTMEKVVRADAVAGEPRTFATNRLTIVVPPDNPAGITSLADLTEPDTAVVVCAPQVPCGAATEDVERAAGIRLHPVSEESDVKDVLHKVVAGEADAGLVYVTDARAAGEKVRTIGFPASREAVNRYPVAALRGANHPRLAEEFIRFVRGPVGRQILGEHGFGAP